MIYPKEFFTLLFGVRAGENPTDGVFTVRASRRVATYASVTDPNGREYLGVALLNPNDVDEPNMGLVLAVDNALSHATGEVMPIAREAIRDYVGAMNWGAEPFLERSEAVRRSHETMIAAYNRGKNEGSEISVYRADEATAKLDGEHGKSQFWRTSFLILAAMNVAFAALALLK